jgi:hypothetical protein
MMMLPGRLKRKLNFSNFRIGTNHRRRRMVVEKTILGAL